MGSSEFHKRIVVGIEIEAYSIDPERHAIGLRLSRPRRGLCEDGERFTRDWSIGSEYNSRPFSTVRESLFLLKSGLRKYLRSLYRTKKPDIRHPVPLLVGGWTNRFAGAHLHLSVADRTLSRKVAASLSAHIHDLLPLVIAVTANSPVWDGQVTDVASNRILRGTRKYFKLTKRGHLRRFWEDELVYSPKCKTKPATLEVRVLDSNIPEYVVAAICLVKAAALRWLRRNGAPTRISHAKYARAREDAASRGMRSHLFWNGDELTASRYLDRFLWVHRAEIGEMDVPEDIFEIFRLLKRGFNGARVIEEAVRISRKEHPQTWQQRFAKRYSQGLHRLLSGDPLRDFARALKVKLPDTDRIWLGSRRASIDE